MVIAYLVVEPQKSEAMFNTLEVHVVWWNNVNQTSHRATSLSLLIIDEMRLTRAETHWRCASASGVNAPGGFRLLCGCLAQADVLPSGSNTESTHADDRRPSTPEFAATVYEDDARNYHRMNNRCRI